jgi:hypothetical protein
MGWRNAEQEERSFLDSKDARRVVLDARTHELEASYRVVSGGVRDDLRRAIEAHDQAIGAFNEELMKHTRGEPPVKKVEVGNK